MTLVAVVAYLVTLVPVLPGASGPAGMGVIAGGGGSAGAVLGGTPTALDRGRRGEGASSVRHAEVTIDSLSGQATVYVNGQPAGPTPWRSTEAVGTPLQIRLQRPGYQDNEVSISVNDHDNTYAVLLEKAR